MKDIKSPKEERAEELKEAKERYKYAEEYWADNRKAAIEDMEFRAGAQWPTAIKDLRDKDNRPCLVVDKCNQYVRQVVNDGRQNRASIKVRPVDSDADPEVAEALNGIVRHILDRSNADIAFDSALESAVVGGFGYFRVLTEYEHAGTFNQDIVIKRIRNPLTVLLDPDAKEADGSDAKYAFVVDELDKEEFEATYPKAEKVDWQVDDAKYESWATDKKVRVCEYWYLEEEDAQIHLLGDGTTCDDETYQKAIAEGLTPPAIVETRTISKPKVRWMRISGTEILEERDWLGRYIPILPVYGNEYDIDGKVTYSGLIRPIKDPQRLYNYSRSAFAERVALTPKTPYVAAVGQVESHENEWANANSGNYSVLRYDPIDINGSALPPPQRQMASDIPAGFAQDMQLSEHDIQAAIGMYAASLGQQSNEKSGKAILARQREGDTGTFHYHDNLNRAIRHLGRILVDLIPKIYDSQRVVRILGDDGSVSQVQIDPMQAVANQKLGSKSIFNLNVGVYDVAVSAGASYNTKRQESVDAMMQMAQANPGLMQFIGDIMFRNMDWPGAEDIADRLKAMLPPQIAALENKDEQPQMPPGAQQAMQQASEHIQQQDQQIQQMLQELQSKQTEEQKIQLDAQIAQMRMQLDAQKLQIEQFRAETERAKVQAEVVADDAASLSLEQWKAQLADETARYKAQLDAEVKLAIAQLQSQTTLTQAQMQSAEIAVGEESTKL